jgi:hypothetical protein
MSERNVWQIKSKKLPLKSSKTNLLFYRIGFAINRMLWRRRPRRLKRPMRTTEQVFWQLEPFLRRRSGTSSPPFRKKLTKRKKCTTIMRTFWLDQKTSTADADPPYFKNSY